MLCRPHALLLDFGGVLVEAPSLPPAPLELVQRVHRLVDDAVPTDRIAADLVAGARAYAAWRDRVSREDQPAELSHAQVWGDFVAADWPLPARQAVRREATALSYAWTWRPDWAVRPGIAEALAAAVAADLPLAVVSNALCGAAHRDFLAAAGLGDRFAAQLYSDEAGLRKPHPGLLLRAAAAVGVPVEQCWFVGDSLSRDIACARRAGAGAAILMRSARTAREVTASELAPGPVLLPDATVDDGHGLRALVADSGPHR